MSGINKIKEERKSQIEKHGFTPEMDSEHNSDGQLVIAALIAANPHRADGVPQGWDSEVLNRIKRKQYKERLIIAGALIAAEIDRIDLGPHLITYDEAKIEMARGKLVRHMMWRWSLLYMAAVHVPDSVHDFLYGIEEGSSSTVIQRQVYRATRAKDKTEIDLWVPDVNQSDRKVWIVIEDPDPFF